MFFADRNAALQEMWRVLRPGGCLAVAVWDTVEHSPGYAAMIALLQRLFGKSIANELRAPFLLGNPAELRELFATAGLNGAELTHIVGQAHFPSIQDWVLTDIRGWTLADKIDDTQFAVLRHEAETALAPFQQTDGSVVFNSPGHIAIIRK